MSQCLYPSLSWKTLHPIEIQMLLLLSTPPFHSLTKSLSLQTLSLLRPLSRRPSSAMSTRFQPHAFAGNPIRAKSPKSTDPLSPNSALDALKSALLATPHDPVSPNFRVLPFRKGRPLAGSGADPVSSPGWHLGCLSLAECWDLLAGSEVKFGEDSLVYLGCRQEEDVVYWAIDFSEDSKVVEELGRREFSFVALRTLMVATDWADSRSMGELAVAGRIMPVIDKENDRALLSRQSRFVPRMWSCLAGFMEPGESLEEAVRRETWEETGIEVGEVVYHSSQPWPVVPSGIPCQLMVGFCAYAKSLEINVDKEELEDAQWHSREDVKKALACAEYKKAQTTAAAKVDQMFKGVGKGQSLSADFNVESGELAPMFILVLKKRACTQAQALAPFNGQAKLTTTGATRCVPWCAFVQAQGAAPWAPWPLRYCSPPHLRVGPSRID